MPRSTPLVKDWFTLGLASGAVGAVVKDLVNLALERAGVPVVPYSSAAGSLILGPRERLGGLIPPPPRTTGEDLVGYATDIVFGSLFGAGMSYVISMTPPGRAFVKGAAGGALLWAMSIGAGHLLKVRPMERLAVGRAFSSLAVTVLYGAVQGALLERYGSRLIHQSHPALVKETSDRGFERGLKRVRRTRPLHRALTAG